LPGISTPRRAPRALHQSCPWWRSRASAPIVRKHLKATTAQAGTQEDMSPPQAIPSAARPLSAGAIALMLMLCLTWGFNQIAVKLVLPDIPPMLQATFRSMGALPVLFIIGSLRGVKFFERDGTWKPGVIAGLMFGIEFVLIFQGLRFTPASRAV